MSKENEMNDIDAELETLSINKKSKNKGLYKCIYYKKDSSDLDTQAYNLIETLQQHGLNCKSLAFLLMSKYAKAKNLV